MNEIKWQTTYPTLATIIECSFETLCAWCDNLPEPENDVQRTVLRRAHKRRDDMARKQINEQHPDIAKKFNEVIDKMEQMGIMSPVDRM